MKKITIVATLFLSLCLILISCNETKKEVKSETTEEVKKEVEEIKVEVKTEIHEHSDQMAMVTFQCPMKCEGDKTYTEEGKCPKCKMELKKIEVEVEEEGSDDTEKSTEDKEENK